MNDWEYDMWWDAIHSLYAESEDYDDMDDWQGCRSTFWLGFSYVQRMKNNLIFQEVFGIILLGKKKGNKKIPKIFVRLSYEKQLQ